MIEQLHEPPVKVLFEVDPQILDRVEVRKLGRLLHKGHVILFEEFDHWQRFIAWRIVLHEY